MAPFLRPVQGGAILGKTWGENNPFRLKIRSRGSGLPDGAGDPRWARKTPRLALRDWGAGPTVKTARPDFRPASPLRTKQF